MTIYNIELVSDPKKIQICDIGNLEYATIGIWERRMRLRGQKLARIDISPLYRHLKVQKCHFWTFLRIFLATEHFLIE